MNILFIYSQKDSLSGIKPLPAQTTIQLGISYISSFLKQNGHETKLLVLTKQSNLNVVDYALKTFLPSLICFTAVYSEYIFISDVAQYIKISYPEIYLLAGGPHVSLNPENCLSDSFDALCIGEGEEATLELINQLERKKAPSNIRNLWIKYKNNVEKNFTRPFLKDLDNLPFPDRQMWQEWIDDRKSSWPILLGRGCPFQCTYCCNHALRQLADGEYVRNRSINNVLCELEELTDKRKDVEKVYFEIETFGVNINWSIELCGRLAEFNKKLSQPLSFGINLRITPNIRLKELYLAMKEANFAYVNIGLESGNERVRKTILNRNYSNKDLLNAVNLAKECGLKVSLFIMVGIPGETAEDFKDTIKMARVCLADYYELFIFFPYPGTILYQIAKQNELIPLTFGEEKERSRPILDLPGFSKREILSNYIWFEYYIYKDYKPLLNILAVVLRNKIYSSYILYTIIRKILLNKYFFNITVKIKNLLISKKS